MCMHAVPEVFWKHVVPTTPGKKTNKQILNEFFDHLMVYHIFSIIFTSHGYCIYLKKYGMW